MASYSVYHNANFQSFVRYNYHLPLKKGKYDDIKRKAKDQQNMETSRRAKSSTVYTSEYGEKGMDETSQAKKRPSSPTRMNKPHPPEIFLVTRLHNLPGHYNCEKGTSLKTGCGFTTSNKHTQGVRSETKNTVQIFRGSNTNLAAQAWKKLASEKDCEAIGKMMEFITETDRKRADLNIRRSHICQMTQCVINTLHHIFYTTTSVGHQKNQMLIQTMKPEFHASAHHWLLNAGTEETAAVERLLRTLSTVPLISTMKEETDSSRVRKAQRSEFVIHPEWRIQA